MSTIIAPSPETDTATIDMSAFAQSIYEQKYAWKDEDGNVTEDWPATARRVAKHVLGALGYTDSSEEYHQVVELITQRKFIPGGRYLYASGRPLHQTQNCLLMRAEDSREGWAELLHNSAMALQTGAGIGIDYSDVRPSGSPIRKTGGVASGPIPLMNMVNEVGRGVMQGGSRRSAIWAGLRWDHGDIHKFIRCKDWTEGLRALKKDNPNQAMPMEFTNISVQLDDEFFEAYDNMDHPKHHLALDVYLTAISRMVKTGEPGFSIDVGDNAGETLRNACTEITSHDDSDICNLGSINLGRIESPEELRHAVRYSTLFLLAGTVYSDLPYDKVDEIRTKNRRLGLGILGLHEWLLKRGYRYEPNDELAEWLSIYTESDDYAEDFAMEHGLSIPIKTRAIAPTGTIGIVAETTTGIEPIYASAFIRSYLDGENLQERRYQYVVDPTARRLIEEHGVEPDAIESAYGLSYNVERRIAFQAWVQQYVDHAISSTINLPYPITDKKEAYEFGDLLYEYLPKLRGVTCFPDGARDHQPLTVIPYEEAIKHEGVVFEEDPNPACASGVCGA
jgi:ribonucleoside-diphosphate reductase alpha chain